MRSFAKRLLVLVALAAMMFGATAPLAGANDELCPFFKVKGKRYEVCLHMPL